MNSPSQVVVFRSNEHPQMPWKNGQGITTEIMVYPPGAGLADFAWRVSMATVSQDGAFSTFDDIDRTLSVLSGTGIKLVVGQGDTIHLTKTSTPFSFAADAPAIATLIGSDITDLNAMSRRGSWRHHVTRISDKRAPSRWSAQSHTTLWFCAHGKAALSDGSKPPIELGAGDALQISSGNKNNWTISADYPAVLFLIELDPVSQKPTTGISPNGTAL